MKAKTSNMICVTIFEAKRKLAKPTHLYDIYIFINYFWQCDYNSQTFLSFELTLRKKENAK